MRASISRVLGRLARAAALAAVSSALFATPASAGTNSDWYRGYLEHGRQIRLANGRSLHLYCEGSGTPTVILEAGLGGWAYDWRAVQDDIASVTRVCAYDRAGMGMSPAGPFPRDTRAQVADLEALLSAAKLSAPYVLVGHSMGAYNVRVFASRHRDEVAGIVLVDPATENQLKTFYAALPNIAKSDAAALDRIRACSDPHRSAAQAKDCARAAPKDFSPRLAQAFAKTQSLSASQTFRSEVESFMTADSREVASESRDFGAMPLIVLTRTELSSNMTKDQADLEWALWKEMHDKLAKLSTIGVNRLVSGSGHYIQLDKPDAVTSAVKEVVASVKKQR